MDVSPDSDWNGSNIQRRRVYSRNPIYQHKHHIQFDWHPQDLTYFDTHGYKGKQRQQNAMLRQKYTEITDQQLNKKYVEGVDAHPLKKIKKYQGGKEDSLTMELTNFNQSKNIVKQTSVKENTKNPENIQPRSKREVMSRSVPSERERKQQETSRKLSVVSPQDQQVRIEPAYHPDVSSPQISPREMLGSSKPNYETIDPQPYYAPPASPTYRTIDNPSPTRPTFSQQPKLQPFSVVSRVSPSPIAQQKMLSSNHSPANSYDYPSMVNRYDNPGKLLGSMYTGVSMQDYPFRNVKPDNLQNHLRDKTKADHRRRVKVDLNLHDYHKP